MGPISSGLGEVFQLSTRNERLTTMQIEELLDWQIAPLLRGVPAIVEVVRFAGEDEPCQVVLDPNQLQAALDRRGDRRDPEVQRERGRPFVYPIRSLAATNAATDRFRIRLLT